MSGAIIVDRVVITEENGAHKDLALNRIRVFIGVLLGHHTAERVSSYKNTVSSETSLAKLLDCLFNVVVDQDRLWSVKYELRETNPDFLSGRSTLPLDLVGKSCISIGITLHTVDPEEH